MDPTNTNSTQPAATPAEPAAPVAPAPAAPAAPAPASPIPSPASPVNEQPAPVAPVAPAAAPVNPDVANAALNPPVPPVVAPGANAAPAAGGSMSMNQMFQPQTAPAPGVIDDTTPISVPEGPKPPDPVEEELKQPLKAAGPVPGSIGSAVSMPQQGGAQPQNVAFNDPANAGQNPMTADPAAPAGKKPNILDKLMSKTKMNKTTLILLCVVAGLVVLVLVATLIMAGNGML